MEKENRETNQLPETRRFQFETLPVEMPNGIAEFVRAHIPRKDVLLPSDFQLSFLDDKLAGVVFRMGPFRVVLCSFSEKMRMVDIIISADDEENAKRNYNKHLTVAAVRSHPLLGGWWVADFFAWKAELEKMYARAWLYVVADVVHKN